MQNFSLKDSDLSPRLIWILAYGSGSLWQWKTGKYVLQYLFDLKETKKVRYYFCNQTSVFCFIFLFMAFSICNVQIQDFSLSVVCLDPFPFLNQIRRKPFYHNRWIQIPLNLESRRTRIHYIGHLLRGRNLFREEYCRQNQFNFCLLMLGWEISVISSFQSSD